MQSAIDAFNKANSVPQICNHGNVVKYIMYKDKLGLCQFIKIVDRPVDCCGFVYRLMK